MNIYRRRPFALALSICILASAAASFMPNGFFRILLMIAVVILTAAFFCFFRFVRKGVVLAGARAEGLSILCGIGCVFMILSAVAAYDKTEYYDRLVIPEDAEPDHSAVFVVNDVNFESGYRSVYTVSIKRLDGVAASGDGLVFIDSAAELQRGDKFSCRVSFRHIDEVYSAYGMTKGRMNASGWSFACDAVDVVFLGKSETINVLTRVAVLRERLNATLGLYLDKDSAGFAGALLLAVRNEPAVIRRDFGRIGAAHLLALSGIHLTIICGILDFALRKLMIPKRLRAAVSIIFVAGFLILTGIPYSALRAGIMFSIASLMNIFRRGGDRLTSLFAAGAVILLFSPTAIFDMGFTLSFTATFGVIVLSHDSMLTLIRLFRPYVKRHKWLKKLRTAISALITSVGAVMFLIPLEMLYFGNVSLLGVVSTFLLAPLCELTLWLLVPLLAASLLRWGFIARLIALPVMALVKASAWIAARLSATHSLVSLKYPFAIPIIIAFFVAVIIMMAKNVRSWMWSLIPFFTSVAVYLGLVGTVGVFTRDDVGFIYHFAPKNDIAVVTSENKGYIIDMTNGNTAMMTGAADLLQNEYMTEAEACILTHLHERHAYSLRILCSDIMVRTIVLPEPTNEKEEGVAQKIGEVADEFGAGIVYYERPDDAMLTFGNVHLILFRTAYIDRSTHPLIGFRLFAGGKVIGYVGASGWENEELGDIIADTIIYGTHGPKVKSLPEKRSGRIFSPLPELVEGIGAEPLYGDLTIRYKKRGG